MIDTAKFWKKIKKEYDEDYDEDHWIWLGNISKNGYGRLTINGIQDYAHRWAWQMVYGPLDNPIVRECERTRCVNPRHWKVA